MSQEEFAFDMPATRPPPTTFFPEREEAIEQMEERFGIILNKKVRVTLRGLPDEFTGKLTIDHLIPPQSRKDELILRIGRATFDWREIESCVAVKDGE